MVSASSGDELGYVVVGAWQRHYLAIRYAPLKGLAPPAECVLVRAIGVNV